MANRTIVDDVLPLVAAAAFALAALVFCSAAHAQTTFFLAIPAAPLEPDCEQHLCFEPGRVHFASPDDVGRFLSEHAPALGLSGREQFQCRRQGWIADFGNNRFPEFAFRCAQVSVQGHPGLWLGMTVNFWSNEHDVRLVRCDPACVSELEPLPTASISADAAMDEASTFIVSRHPDVSRRRISFASSVPQLAVEPRRTEHGFAGVRVAWRVTASFPSPYGRGRAKLEIGVDATTGDVFFVNDVGSSPLHGGWSVDELFALRAELGDIAAWTAADFARWQELNAFGAVSAELQRRRTESLAQWYPDGESRFMVHFTRPLGTDEVASLIGDYALPLETLGYYVAAENGEAASDSVTLFAGREVVDRQRLVDAINRQRELVQDPDHEPVYGTFYGQHLDTPERAQFAYAVVRMKHRSALELAYAETGRRVLAVNAVMESFPLPSH